MAKETHNVSELESRKVAEASREAEWKQPSFLREMFLGDFRLDLIHPYPLPADERPEFAAFYNAIDYGGKEIDDVRAAHERIESNETFGKVVLMM